MLQSQEMPKHGRRGYHFRRSKSAVPRQRKPTTTFDALARAALPGPQFTERLANLLGEGTSHNTIKAWRYGYRPAPQWAIDQVLKACLAIRDTADAAIQQQIKKEASESAGP